MLRIYPVALEVVRMLQPVIEKVARRDKNLADQMDRASTSVVLNMCEGDASQGATRRHKYETSLREARETVGCLDTMEAKGRAVRPPGIDAKLNHVIGTLVNLTR